MPSILNRTVNINSEAIKVQAAIHHTHHLSTYRTVNSNASESRRAEGLTDKNIKRILSVNFVKMFDFVIKQSQLGDEREFKILITVPTTIKETNDNIYLLVAFGLDRYFYTNNKIDITLITTVRNSEIKALFKNMSPNNKMFSKISLEQADADIQSAYESSKITSEVDEDYRKQVLAKRRPMKIKKKVK